MTDKKNSEKTLDCHKYFKEIPWDLYSEALSTLNKQFHTHRAGHIEAVQLGRGAELQAVNNYHQNKKIAIHEAGHIMAVWYGGSMNSVSSASIKAKWLYYHRPKLHITPIRKYPPETLADLFEELCFCLSGRIAETMFFPEEPACFPYFMNYRRSDIHKAINVAFYMAKIESGIDVFEKGYFEIIIPKNVIEDVSCFLIRGYEATTDLLKTRADLLLKVGLELLDKKELKLDSLLTLLGPPKKRTMSLYDRFCSFSMELRPLAKKRYCLNKPRRSKNVKKRKTSASCKKKKSNAQAKRSKKSRIATSRRKKEQGTGNPSTKRKRSDSNAPKKRKTMVE